MRPLADARTMQRIDRTAEKKYHLSGLVLMENAGVKAVHYLLDHEWANHMPSGLLAFAAGRGNNGGDAFVMARQFYVQGITEVALILTHGEPVSDSISGINLHICRALGIPVFDWEKNRDQAQRTLATCDAIFDGITGTGLAGEASGPAREVITAINDLNAYTVAIDVPSGTGGSFKKGFPAVKADLTLTFGLPKDFLYYPLVRPLTGKIVTINLGFPPVLLADPALPGRLLEAEDFHRLLPPLPAHVHKGTRGHLAVCAGSPGKSGAAILASLAAARSRAGLVTLYTDPSIREALSSRLVSVMTHTLTEKEISTPLFTDTYRALLVGPGFGLKNDKPVLFEKLYRLPLPKLIDADGLTLLAAADPDILTPDGPPVILTPHPGECARLLGVTVDTILENPVASAVNVSQRYKAICVLKGHVTFISVPDGTYAAVDGMNPAMATAGSGDVLAGITAAFLTQGMDARTSAYLGVLLHARVGRLAVQRRGFFLAEDLLEFLSPAFLTETADYPT
jgi:NAD(P)H-hydrate epimerase